METILFVEDDAATAAVVLRELSGRGYDVTHIADGADGLNEAMRRSYDLLIIDRLLPRLDGVSLIETLRAKSVLTPILVLSALADVDHRVFGLVAGADDYLPKPFAASELAARVAAMLRRGAMVRETLLRVGPLELDLIERVARKDGRTIDLLPREFDLLDYLMRHAGQAISRTMLLKHVWNYNFAAETNVIDVHIGKLRRKLEDPDGVRLIHSVKGIGFMLSDSA